MPYYRLDHFRNGRVARSSDLQADDDVAAVRGGRELVADDAAELWCGARKVSTFNAPGPGW